MIRWLLAMVVLMVLMAPVASLAVDDAEPTNPTCPVMEGEPVDPAIFVDHEGRRIWFCSEIARDLFVDAPADYIDALPLVEAPAARASYPLIKARELTAGQPGSSPGAAAPSMPAGILIGRLHPAAVHLPIGFVVAAAAMAFCRALWPRARWCPPGGSVLWLVVLAAPAAVAAALTGWQLAVERPQVGLTGEVLELHRWLGVATAWLLVVACWVLVRIDIEKNRWWAAAILGALTLLLGATGHLGGALVYGLDFLPF